MVLKDGRGRSFIFGLGRKLNFVPEDVPGGSLKFRLSENVIFAPKKFLFSKVEKINLILEEILC